MMGEKDWSMELEEAQDAQELYELAKDLIVAYDNQMMKVRKLENDNIGMQNVTQVFSDRCTRLQVEVSRLREVADMTNESSTHDIALQELEE